jgi:hypothetical protein
MVFSVSMRVEQQRRGFSGVWEPRWSYLFAKAGFLNHDTQIGAAVKVLGGIAMLAVVAWLIWRVWRQRKTRSEGTGRSVAAASAFGDLGMNLDEAMKSGFWQWFHFEQTREENGVHRFEPSGPKFDSLCYLDVRVAAKNALKAITLGVQRRFISGSEEPFARDLVRSFVCAVFPQQKPEAVSQLVDELGSEFGGSRPVIVAEGARRPAPLARPSALYLVFLGQGKRCMIEAGALMLEAENVSDQSTRWFCLRLKPPAS